MATIPIEVIVQDKASPEPTPTPEPETNIVVPDTGAGTVENGSNGGGIGSAVSIILPAIILVLAIGAIVALLIRRQQRRKNNTNTDISKKEKLVATVSGTIAILAATVLVGNLVIPATSAAADEANDSRESELVVDDKITITVTREADSDNAIVGSIEDKSYATIYKSFGYEVAISMAGSNANLYLDGDESSSYYFSPVEDGVLADNTWGYSLDGGAREYNAVPLADDLAVVDKGAASVTNEEIDIYYGIKVTNDMPAGTYTGELEYTLADTGFPVSLRSMQDMTTDICSSVPTPNPFKADGTTIEDNVPTIMLKDVRDNKLYRVAKLADGKCWMTQNLDLQKEDLVVASLDSTNTDNPADGFALPTSQIDGAESWGDSDSRTDVETPRVYSIKQDTENPYKYCLDYRGRCYEWGNVIPEKELGNLYNWYTATAGTGTYDLGGGDNKEAGGSICPSGWRLPNNSNVHEATDYSTLLYLYGIIESPTSDRYISADKAAIYKAPLLLVPTGFYGDGLGGVGYSGYPWSSLAQSNTYAWELGFFTGSIYPWGSSSKILGAAIHCLAR